MSKEKLMNNLFQWGVLAAIVAVALPELAFAGTGQSIGQSINEFKQEDLTSLPNLLSAVAYIIGGFLGISGALKLKAHAENPAQEKMAPGLARLLAGGGIATLPFLLGTAVQTTHLAANVQFQQLDAIR